VHPFLLDLQSLDIPDNLKELYKTVWEIKQRVLVDMAAGEGGQRADAVGHWVSPGGPTYIQQQWRSPFSLYVLTFLHLALLTTADRGAYIDQSQSFNVHMSDPNFGKLTSLHFYAWKKGLKTGELKAGAWVSAVLAAWQEQDECKKGHHHVCHRCLPGSLCCFSPTQLPNLLVHPTAPAGMYYLRTRAAADAIKFTVDQQALQRRKSERLAKAASSGELKENSQVQPSAKAAAAAAQQDAEKERQLAAMVCSLENKEACLMCSG